MPITFSPTDARVTIESLLASFPYLGIPHFQRGLVWGEDSVSLLLESLFHDTPCGTIILWRPLDPGEAGVGLGAGRPEYLIIDGQQRIRSLQAALHGEGSEEDEEDEEDDARWWCVNLCRLPYFRAFTEERLASFPLFKKFRDPTHKKARYRRDLVPLAPLLGAGAAGVDWAAYVPLPDAAAEREVREQAGPRLVQQVRAMLARSVFLLVKEETDNENHLAAMVQLYNRINSGGKKVESEERAFAALTSLRPDSGRWVRDLFREVHPAALAGGDGEGLVSRDATLVRRKERSFGFKLFIRTFVQACTYHLGYSVGLSSFSFDAVERPEFQETLGDPATQREVDFIFAHTRQAILEVRAALRDLGCDGLQMLPETDSLLPVFQLLIRYPDAVGTDAGRAAVKDLLLRLMLSASSRKELLDLVKRVNGANTFGSCVQELKDYLPVEAHGKDGLEAILEYSNSLQDRYVLLLYWLLRRRGACDFSSDQKHMPESKRAQLEAYWAREGKAIRDGLAPEKQHMVPYSTLKDVYEELSGRTRMSNHEANNIGHLTYISRMLNHFESGLGEFAVDLESEPEDNLRRHLLLEEGSSRGSSRLIQDYTQALAGKQRPFERFCKTRRRLIAEALVDWVETLDDALDLETRIAPQSPLFSWWAKKIRELDLPDGLEDRLIGWLRDGATIKWARRVDKAIDIWPAELKDGRVSLTGERCTITRADLAQKTGLAELVASHYPEVVLDRKSGTLTFSMPMSEANVSRLVAAIEDVAGVVMDEQE